MMDIAKLLDGGLAEKWRKLPIGSMEPSWERDYVEGMRKAADELSAHHAKLVPVIEELVEALRLCQAELRYFPGSSNKEGDALIDRAYNAADDALRKLEGKVGNGE